MLLQQSTALAKVTERLSSGMRLTTPADDSGGGAIAASLRADVRVQNQALRNVNDGISMLSIADAALESLGQIVQRQAELAEQAAQGTYSLAQRAALQIESDALVNEYNRILASASFNDQAIFSPDLAPVRIQMGYGIENSSAFTLGNEILNTIGNGVWSTRQTYSTVGWGESIDTGDLDGDGNLDAVYVLQVSNAVAIRLGNADGSFKVQSTKTTGLTPEGVQVVDVNNDGKKDIVVAEQGSSSVGIFLGNGDGTFQARVSYSTGAGSGVKAIELADLNGDQKLDIVSRSILTPEVSVMLGNGNGTFLATTNYDMGTAQPGNRGTDLALGDINLDGYIDILTADYTEATTSIRLGAGNGSFSSRITIALGAGPFTLRLADLNRDGKLDLIAQERTASRVEIRLGNGDGTFAAGQALSGLSYPPTVGSLEIADMNGDGLLDIVVSGESGASDSVQVMIGNGTGGFSFFGSLAAIGNNPIALHIADINHDGVPDILSDEGSSAVLSVLPQGTTTTFNMPYQYLGSASGSRSALDSMAALSEEISAERARIGATQSRLQSSLRTIAGTIDAYSGALSRIEDADIASDAAEAVRLALLEKAAVAVIEQHTLSAELVLGFLRF